MAHDEIRTRTDGTVEALLGGAVTRIVVPAAGPLSAPEDRNDPGYPDVIGDQRHGYEHLDTDSVEEVAAWWDSMLARRRPPIPVRVREGEEVEPYISHSRWVADCDCGGGMLCWDRNPYTCCLDCGSVWNVKWQQPAMRSEVIRAIAVRPDARHRNWDARARTKEGERVETAAFLHRENAIMLGVPLPREYDRREWTSEGAR